MSAEKFLLWREKASDAFAIVPDSTGATLTARPYEHHVSVRHKPHHHVRRR
jgi:hypothetical protein